MDSYINEVTTICRESGYDWMAIAISMNTDKDGFVDIFHGVGYKSEPDENDLSALVNELKDDSELGMPKLEYGTDYAILIRHSESIINDMGE